MQAKIVNVDTGRVNYLHYRKGEQYELLVDFCRQFRFIPKYSIYGRVNNEAKIFASGLAELRHIPIEQWSFSMVSPKYIKDLKTTKEKHVSNVLKFAIPWSYVFCDKTNNELQLGAKIAQNWKIVIGYLKVSSNQDKAKKRKVVVNE